MKKALITILTISQSIVFAQKKQPDFWFTLSPQADKVYGVASEEAYKTLKDREPTQVIVAVIDSGVDPNHEDLKEVIWTNPNEIPDNNIDDDKNGYIDDIHGWNFMGGKNGDIDGEATELARIYQKQKRKFDVLDTTHLTAKEQSEFAEYKTNRSKFLKEQLQQEQQLKQIEMISAYLENVKKGNNGVLDKNGINSYEPTNDLEKRLKKGLKLAFTLGVKPEELDEQIREGKKQLSGLYNNNKLNADSIRTYIVGDNVNDPTERYYGNNHCQGPDALHGTHVSGMIAAMRDNNLGIKGISNSARIMILRAVPNGDERDKDIANAIRYAVDNGAKIINMSFGKYYSPDKAIVDEAVKYAQSKDVLLIHAAGNE